MVKTETGKVKKKKPTTGQQERMKMANIKDGEIETLRRKEKEQLCKE